MRGGPATGVTLTGFAAGRRRRRRPRSPNDPNDPNEFRDLCEKAEANETPLELEVPKLLTEETLQRERFEPSSVRT